MPHRYRRVNNWAWTKPCSCCKQFDIDQAKKRAKRAQNPTLEAVIARQMNSYYGFNYNRAPTHDLYGCQLTEGSYNPWNSSRNWEE